MKIRFWGVRGSLPSPLSEEQLLSKISAIVQRITPNDIKDSDSRERFIHSLPSYIAETTGGNTACVELTGKDGTEYILDAGSGMRLLGKHLAKNGNGIYHIFLSHLHWDHIQGLPFFDPIYNPNTEIHFYFPGDNLKDHLSEQMRAPFFPAPLSSCTQKMYFHDISDSTSFSCGDIEICWRRMNHPGGSYSYSFTENGHKFIYATDTELRKEDLAKDAPDIPFFKNAEVLVMDAQYTVDEAFVKENWGHSSFNNTVDFSVARNVKNLYLFHHDPTYTDKKLDGILSSARWYVENIGKKRELNVYLAKEGLTINL